MISIEKCIVSGFIMMIINDIFCKSNHYKIIYNQIHMETTRRSKLITCEFTMNIYKIIILSLWFCLHIYYNINFITGSYYNGIFNFYKSYMTDIYIVIYSYNLSVIINMIKILTREKYYYKNYTILPFLLSLFIPILFNNQIVNMSRYLQFIYFILSLSFNIKITNKRIKMD